MIFMYHGSYKRVLALQTFYVKLRQTKAFAPTLAQTSLSQNCSITTLLTNVGLVSSTASSFYYVDGFGNSITIIPYENLQGTLADIHPSFSYMTLCQSGTNCPPFAGVITLSNTNAACVQAGAPYCYLQFTYP